MLTAKQHQTYEYICLYIKDHGYAPTEAEIAAGIGITSRGVVHRYVCALADSGLIRIMPNRRRNIELVSPQNDDDEGLTLPILGKIAAGHPLETIASDKVLNISSALLGPERFILEVKGDSMLGDNICDGDYIICERRSKTQKNDIVVALIDQQEATLKRIQVHEDDSVTLHPSNPHHQPQHYGAERVEIQGVYLGLLRLN